MRRRVSRALAAMVFGRRTNTNERIEEKKKWKGTKTPLLMLGPFSSLFKKQESLLLPPSFHSPSRSLLRIKNQQPTMRLRRALAAAAAAPSARRSRGRRLAATAVAFAAAAAVAASAVLVEVRCVFCFRFLLLPFSVSAAPLFPCPPPFSLCFRHEGTKIARVVIERDVESEQEPGGAPLETLPFFCRWVFATRKRRQLPKKNSLSLSLARAHPSSSSAPRSLSLPPRPHRHLSLDAKNMGK